MPLRRCCLRSRSVAGLSWKSDEPWGKWSRAPKFHWHDAAGSLPACLLLQLQGLFELSVPPEAWRREGAMMAAFSKGLIIAALDG